MQVRSTQNTPNFTGYVSKGLKKHINNLVKEECNKVIQQANKNQEQVDVAQLRKSKEMGQYIIKTLDDFMAKTHKNSVLSYKHPAWEEFFPLVFKNSKTGTDISFRDTSCTREKNGTFCDYGTFASMSFPYNRSKTTLSGLAMFATKLKTIFNPADFDKQLFNQYVSDIKTKRVGSFNRISNFIKMKKALKAEKMAPEFGVERDGIVFGVKRGVVLSRFLAKEDKTMKQQEKASKRLKAQKIAEEQAKQKSVEQQNEEIYKTVMNK